MGLVDRLGQRRLPPSPPSTVEAAQPAPSPGPEPAMERPRTPPAERAARPTPRPAGDRIAEVRKRIQSSLLETLGPKMYDEIGGDEDLAAKVRETIGTLLNREETPLSGADRTRIAQEVLDEILGHGPIEPLLRDPQVNEVMVNGYNKIWVERAGRLAPVDAEFTDEAHLRRVIDRIVSRVGRRVDESSPMVDARLPDGSRVNAVVPPIALDGSALTIRKFATDPLTVDDLISFGTFTPPVAQLLAACVQGRLDIVVSGGTGSGKTTTLNVLSGFIPAEERVVTVEDAAELQLHQDHVVR